MPGLGEIARKAARRLPKPARDALKRARRRYRRARYEARERRDPVLLSPEQVAAALREAGVADGDTVFIQAAMSAFGKFVGGPQTVIEGARRALGDRGTLAMPTYPLDMPMLEYLSGDPLFDVRATPSKMGAISERFRQAEGSVRSLHPTHPVSASGPLAPEITSGHESAATPFGYGTPFAALRDRDALQVFFGCGTGPMTFYHCFECTREPAFPFDVFADRVFEARCVDADGRDRTVHTLVHNPRFLDGRIDSNPRIQALFRERILGVGGKTVSLGRGEIIAVRLGALFELFEALIREGITIYEQELPVERPELPPQERIGA